MALARVHESYRAEFERRLSTIAESLSYARKRIREMYDSWNVDISQTDVYITGGCAAWLIGRFDDFNDIDLFFINNLIDLYNLDESRYRRMYWKKNRLNDDDDDNAFTRVLDINEKDENGFRKIQFCYVENFKNVENIRRGFRNRSMWEMFDMEAVSTYIDLFDTTVIYTTDYDSAYDRRCLVTNNGCVRHGTIVYPLLMRTDHETFTVNTKDEPYVRTSPSFNDRRKPTDVERLEKYVNRVKYRQANDALDRPLSFLRLDNCLIRRHETLIRKVFRHWQHRTLAPPHGYGYRKCMKRFEENKFLNFIKNDDRDFCTCKNAK